MDKIEDYLKQTKSAVQKLYEAYGSYYELMRTPVRPVFFAWGDHESEENKAAYEHWRLKNQNAIEESIKRDNEFAFESFARSTLGGTILQFAYHAIKRCSTNGIVPYNFSMLIKPNSEIAKFCIGRVIDEVPLGLIVYAGRNQAMHYDDKRGLKEPNKTIFDRLANWYSNTSKKWYVDSFYDLNNKTLIHYAANILYKLGWSDYNLYEKDITEMFRK